MASQDWLDKDFYQTLGVKSDVSEAELRKAYRRLARKHHPDSNPEPKNEGRFKEITEAYTVLSDPEQRQEYDQLRAYGAGPRFTATGAGFEDVFGTFFRGNPGGQQGGRSGGPGPRPHVGGSFGSFGSIFGGAPGYEADSYTAGLEPQETHAEITVDLRAAAAGETVSLRLSDGEPLRVKIPAGIKNGQKMRVSGKGQPPIYDGGKPGDLVLTVQVRNHPVFERDGKNLRLKLPISFAEAALGATVEVPTLGRRRVKIKIPPGTPTGRVLRVRGEGMKAADGPGDLLAELQIMPPKHPTAEIRKLMEQLQELSSADDLRSDLLTQAEL